MLQFTARMALKQVVNKTGWLQRRERWNNIPSSVNTSVTPEYIKQGWSIGYDQLGDVYKREGLSQVGNVNVLAQETSGHISLI